MPVPTPQQLEEIRQAQRRAGDADARGEDSEALYAAAVGLMRKYGAAEEPPGDLVDDSLAAGNNDILTAAILQAQTDGDTATVEKLKALADKPGELAAVLQQLAAG